MKYKQIYKHEGLAYIVLSQKPVHSFASRMDEDPDMQYVQEYMQWLGADRVLRTQSHFMFCETILDVEFETIQ